MSAASTTSRRRLAAAALLVSAGAGLAASLGAPAPAQAGPQVTVPAPPPASDRYVAIAYSPGKQFAGLSINTTHAAASTEAKSRCSTKAGDCEVVVVWKNGCAALAVDGTRYFGGAGNSYAQANADARLGLGGFGVIKASQCVVR